MKIRHFEIGLLASLLACVMLSPSVQAAPTPRKIFAMSQIQPGGAPEQASAPSDTVVFYDVTDIGTDPNASGVFGGVPLFSVWMGFEIFDGNVGDVPTGLPTGNREEFSAITFNPANGTIYAAAFDSSAAGIPDSVGDNQGDFDLYKIDYQAILKDFTDFSRPKGTIYAPKKLGIRVSDEDFMRTNGSKYYDGTVDGFANDIPHPSDPNGVNTVHLVGAFDKIGQVGREFQAGAAFFDHQLDFVNPERLLLSGVRTAAAGGDPNDDFHIRALSRVSTDPNMATLPTGTLQEGGWHNRRQNNFPVDPNAPFTSQASESWEAHVAGFLGMDPDPNGSPSELAGWALVNKTDGTLGLWIADGDSGFNGDDLSYFKLDLSDPNNPTAIKQSLSGSIPGGGDGTFLGLADNPASDPNSNDGEIDALMVDKDGNLVIVESGFFDTDPNSTVAPRGSGGFTAEEPKVITVGIADYDAAGVVTTSSGTGFLDAAAYAVSASVPVSGANDNDPDVTNSTKVAYDKSTGYIYIVDTDATDPNSPDPNNPIFIFAEDLYVFDPATGTIIYHELTPFNPGIFNEGTQVVFTRGDIDGSGSITYADIQAMQDAIADNTLGGAVSAAVGAEWYDLTGDGALTAADLTELVVGILNTSLGDFNLDGLVNGSDFLAWQIAFGSSFDGGDLADWEAAYGFVAPLAALAAASAAVPEPATIVLLAIGLMGLARRRRG